MNFEMKNMNTNEKNTKCYMNLQNNHVHSYLLNDNNRSIMNRSLFATSLKNWFVSGAAVLLIILASGLDVLAQNVSLTYTGATTWTVPPITSANTTVFAVWVVVGITASAATGSS